MMLWLALLACAPKKNNRSADVDYFPLRDGAKWTYRGVFGAREDTEGMFAIREELDGVDAFYFVDESDMNDDVAFIFSTMFGLGVYHRTDEGLETAEISWRSDVSRVRADQFQPMLRLPPVLGDSIQLNTASPDRKGAIRVEAIEDLTVPAGRFEDCAKLSLGQGSYAWLAPGVGLVKWIFVTGRVEELVAYEP